MTYAMTRVPQQPVNKRPDYGQYVEPTLVTVAQLAAATIMTYAMSTLTTNIIISLATTVFAIVTIPMLLSIVFSKSALQWEAVKVLAKSPGGFIFGATAVSVVLFLWAIQPVLWANGYSTFGALASTVFIQFPLSARIVLVSGPRIKRIFAETWYTKAIDGLEREIRIKHSLDMASLIRDLVVASLRITKGKAMEAQFKEILGDTELSLSHMTTLVTGMCDDGHLFGNPIYEQMYDAVSAHVKAADAPPVLGEHSQPQGQSADLVALSKIFGEVE
jgi:hypothetical protein